MQNSPPTKNMEAVLSGNVHLEGSSLVWDGVWGMPTPTKNQKFHYEAAPSQFKLNNTSSSLLLPPGRTVVFTGQFEMLNPHAVSKRSTCREKRLELCNSKRNKIKGSGSNRFGSFQLTGEFDPKTNLLQVRRKYTGKPKPQRVQQRRSSPTKQPFSDHFPQAQSLLFDLQQRDKSGWFAQPVDVSKPGMEHYADVVNEPIDFSTIENKFKHKQYQSLWECVEDMRLVMRNAIQFNPKGSAVFRAAQDLQFLLESRTKYWTFDGNNNKQRRVRTKEVEEEEPQCGFDSFDELGDVDADDFHSANNMSTPSPITQLDNDLEISSVSCSSPITLEDISFQ